MNATMIVCGPGKVPGWLDEHGQPTSCVDDNPTPGVPKDAPVVPEIASGVPSGAVSVSQMQPAVPHYVETGVHVTVSGEWLVLVIIAAALAAGCVARIGRRK